MLMSKHHYAVELSKMGNTVYFINHPDRRHRLKRGEVRVAETRYKNLFSVSHRLIHPYFFKYKYKGVYNFLTALHLKKLIRKIGAKPDVVWTFDIGNSLPLKYFPPCEAKIYMPVDGPYGTADEKLAPEEADLIISVAPKILEQYSNVPLPRYCINHGMAEVFINPSITMPTNAPLRIGYSGSLVRNDLDTKTFLEIISNHPDKVFEFWGENNYKKSTIHLPQDVAQETKDFLDTLHSLPNVVMHGAVSTEILAEGIKRVDALLISYAIKDDQNHHKVLEYLGTGNVIITSYMSSYVDLPELMEMVSSKTDNSELPALFNTVIGNIEKYNSSENRKKRIDYATGFTYPSQVRKVESYLTAAGK